MDSLKSPAGALYIRVSTADQAELSPDAQKRLLLEYAQKNGIFVPQDFIFTESVSGRHAQKRPQFQKMIATAKDPGHPIDVILVWKFSRFARNQEESIVYKSMLKKDRVEVISVSEPLAEGPFGTLIERIIEWMDEYYSIRLSGEVLRGMKEKALRQGYQSAPCLGYEAVGAGRPFVIRKKEFAIVEYIMDLYDQQHLDCTAIARKCNSLGFRTRRGNLFEARGIERILRNPFYCGTVIWNGIEFQGLHETRLSKEQYEARMVRMNAKKKSPARRSVSSCRHWLSGLVKCAVCGASLSCCTSGSCPCFQCWKYAKGLHPGSMSISVNKLEQVVYAYLRLVDDRVQETFVCQQDFKSPLPAGGDLALELEALKAKERRVRLAYENGIDTLEEYRENKCRIQTRIQELAQQLQESSVDRHQTETAEAAPSCLFTGLQFVEDPHVDVQVKGQFLRCLVDEIVFQKETGTFYFDMILS